MSRLPQPLPSDRLARLPVYAQDYISRLAARAEELERELNALLEPNQGATTYADPNGELPKPIGDNPTIRHRLADGSEISIDCQPHRIQISADGASYHQRPVVVPHVSNVLDIVMADTRTLPADPRPKPSDRWKVER